MRGAEKENKGSSQTSTRRKLGRKNYKRAPDLQCMFISETKCTESFNATSYLPPYTAIMRFKERPDVHFRPIVYISNPALKTEENMHGTIWSERVKSRF